MNDEQLQRWQPSETRPMQSDGTHAANDANSLPRGHCHDAEKCNADTFCDCPCVRCMRTKRGEYDAR